MLRVIKLLSVLGALTAIIVKSNACFNRYRIIRSALIRYLLNSWICKLLTQLIFIFPNVDGYISLLYKTYTYPIPTEKCKDMDFNYIKIILQPIFRRNIKGRIGEKGKNEYTPLSKDIINKMDEEIPIPMVGMI